MTNRHHSHRDGVHKNHFVAGTCEAPHQVVLRVWMVIPPILASKTDDGLVLQHRSSGSVSAYLRLSACGALFRAAETCGFFVIWADPRYTQAGNTEGKIQMT